MAMQLSYKIEELRVVKSANGFDDVISEVRMTISTEDESGNTVSLFYVCPLNIANVAEPFIAKDDLTKEVLVGWALNSLSDKQKQEIENDLTEMLNPPDYYYNPTFD